MIGISLFSSAGIGELNLGDIGFFVECANEKIPSRASLFKSVFKNSKMIVGDILDPGIKSKLIKSSKSEIDF